MAAINKLVGHSTLLLALCWLLSVTYANNKTLAIFVGTESVYLVPTRNTSAMGMNLGAVQPVDLSKSPFAASLKQIPEDETPRSTALSQTYQRGKPQGETGRGTGSWRSR